MGAVVVAEVVVVMVEDLMMKKGIETAMTEDEEETVRDIEEKITSKQEQEAMIHMSLSTSVTQIERTNETPMS